MAAVLNSRVIHTLLGALLIVSLAWLCHGADAPAGKGTPTGEKEALARFNPLIGGWRGTAMPRRMSNQGAWREDAEWVWELKKDSVAIRYDVKDGKLVKSAKLTWDAEAKQYRLQATTPDGVARTYTGTLEGNKLALVSEPNAAGEVHRLTVTLHNDKRTLVLHEKRSAKSQTFSRVAEVGYTREGTRLAFDSTTGPECIVTGGAGTIEVSYKGKTYYVCCTGCKQAFEDDPVGVLAEAAQRREEELKARQQAK
jgi:YHS domain-containing protein